MATSDRVSHSTTKDSEEMFDICCSTCEQNGHTVEARKYCQDCAAYVCEECVKQHKKFPALRNHVIDMTPLENRRDFESKTEDLPKCMYHCGNHIIRFCSEHDEVCCAVCIALKHRNCNRLIEIREAAKGATCSKEFKEKKSSFQAIITSLKREQEKKDESSSRWKVEKETLLLDLENYQDSIVAKIKELVCKSEQVITAKFDALEANLKQELTSLHTVTASATRAQSLLTSKHDVTTFVQIKYSKSVIQECEQFLQNLSSHQEPDVSGFALNKDVLGQVDSFGTLIIEVKKEECVKQYKATLIATHLTNLGMPCFTGLCKLDNGCIVVADCNNKQLRTLNEHFQQLAALSVPTYPIGLCQIGGSEVATCLRDINKVQFVSVAGSKLLCTETLDTGCKCWGIAYNEENKNLIVHLDTSVNLYDKVSKTLLRKINKESSWSARTTLPRLCTFSSALNLMLFADSNAGLCATDTDGKLQWVLSDMDLKSAYGVCVLPGGVILVCGNSSNNILQLDRNGKKIGTLVEDIYNPYSMEYDRQNSTLIVGCSNELEVFHLEKK